jgi:hypothetical protein
MNNKTDPSPTRHPKIVEDEKAIEVVLRLEETAPAKDNSPNNGGGGGRRLTVTTIGSRELGRREKPEELKGLEDQQRRLRRRYSRRWRRNREPTQGSAASEAAEYC